MSTKSFSTMPEAFDFTSTFVMGWILPVATTERATSPLVTFAIRLGSMDDPDTMRASATAPPITTTKMAKVTQIHKRLLFFAATLPPPATRKRSRSPAEKFTIDKEAQQYDGRTLPQLTEM